MNTGSSSLEVNFFLKSGLAVIILSRGFLWSSRTKRSSPVFLDINAFSSLIVLEFNLPAFSMMIAPPRSFWIILPSSFLFSDSPVTIATLPCFRFLCFWIAFTISTASTVFPDPLRPMIIKLPVLEVPSLWARLSLSSTATICSLIPLTGTK